MTEAEMDADLAEARTWLPRGRFTAERCRHATVHETALWVYDGQQQIGAICREDGGWRTSAIRNGMPTTRQMFVSLEAAVDHVTRRAEAA